MSLNKIFGLALIISVGWHIFWGLFFDLSLEEKQTVPGREIIPVYYIGKGQIIKDRTTRVTGMASSILPPPSLPQIDIIQPPLPEKKLPQTEEEMLAQRAKEIKEYKTEISSKSNLEPTTGRKYLPNWILPKESSKNKEEPIKWETGKREVIQSYYPSMPQWAQEAGIISNVTLRFIVSGDGEVKEIRTEKSSGDTKLDLLATSYLRRWKFLPSDKNEKATGIITINFQSAK
ncbi:MAG: TonB family protein [Candidatus Ratteibacteria bacterium]|nr:TonB family protein [Candidatus Ratteibacteria bacterium]